jgi:phosphopantothenoylcysteine decarboxylase/phosphopantothenate--cysteine ligase
MSLIALGVTGGIGAYKAVEVARGLQKAGHDVVAIMTRAARKFVGPLTFEAITRRRVITDQFTPGINSDIEHIAIASEIDLLLVAPATANIIGKFANGIADDFLTSLYLAIHAPVLIAPAMNTNMFDHPAVRQNISRLMDRGVQFVDPGSGYLACGWIGKGRLAEPPEIVVAAQQVLQPPGALRGRRVVVTAGPTHEDLDPVRYLGNRSSGKMGFALAGEASRRGADVVLIVGPTHAQAPPTSQLVRVRTAAEMYRAVMEQCRSADVVIMAAAVADYTPTQIAAEKIAKDHDEMTLRLTRTKDILADLGRARGSNDRPLLVGFAAETHDVIVRARAKRHIKRADLIVANDVSRSDAGFGSDANAVTLISADGEQSVPLQGKVGVARAILDKIESMLIGAPAKIDAGDGS